jgi:flagellar FliL protein
MLAIIILGGFAAGGYYYFHNPANASIDPANQEYAGDTNTKSNKSLDKHEFVELDPLILPVMDHQGISQIVSIVVVIEVGSDKKASKVQHLSPRLKDAFIQDMYGAFSHKELIVDGMLQVNLIKERLTSVSQSVLGEGYAEDVLLQVVQQRPI